MNYIRENAPRRFRAIRGIILILILSLLGGCGNSGSKSESKENISGNKPSYLNETGLPIVKEPITLKAFGMMDVSHSDYDKM